MSNSKLQSFYSGKTVLITGSTGFKGSWMSLWLTILGANVIGFSLKPNSEPNLFTILGLEKLITQVYGDINNFDEVNKVFTEYKPEIVFHLAAQPLVRESYRKPVNTFMTNAVGTVHILENIRLHESTKSAVMITTDKVYENKEWLYPYKEVDELGGFDPYSSSKAMAEFAIKSYQRGFFSHGERRIASARAGNVIGGGDWSQDRLIPNIIRANNTNNAINIFPKSVRPWQHVLEPLYGYLLLGEKLYTESRFVSAFNFGPDFTGNLSVLDVTTLAHEYLGSGTIYEMDIVESKMHEAGLLLLDNTKAKTLLDWYPKLEIKTAIKMTIDWYNAYKNKENMSDYTINQIEQYTKLI